MKVKPHHPLIELLAKKLFGIECVTPEYQKRMVRSACKAAVRWHYKTMNEAILSIMEKKHCAPGMPSETWYKLLCSECSCVNWICNGDESDLTAMDVNGFFCYKCGEAHMLYEYQSDDEENYETGRKQPM